MGFLPSDVSLKDHPSRNTTKILLSSYTKFPQGLLSGRSLNMMQCTKVISRAGMWECTLLVYFLKEQGRNTWHELKAMEAKILLFVISPGMSVVPTVMLVRGAFKYVHEVFF